MRTTLNEAYTPLYFTTLSGVLSDYYLLKVANILDLPTSDPKLTPLYNNFSQWLAQDRDIKVLKTQDITAQEKELLEVLPEFSRKTFYKHQSAALSEVLQEQSFGPLMIEIQEDIIDPNTGKISLKNSLQVNIHAEPYVIEAGEGDLIILSRLSGKDVEISDQPKDPYGYVKFNHSDYNYSYAVQTNESTNARELVIDGNSPHLANEKNIEITGINCQLIKGGGAESNKIDATFGGIATKVVVNGFNDIILNGEIPQVFTQPNSGRVVFNECNTTDIAYSFLTTYNNDKIAEIIIDLSDPHSAQPEHHDIQQASLESIFQEVDYDQGKALFDQEVDHLIEFARSLHKSGLINNIEDILL